MRTDEPQNFEQENSRPVTAIEEERVQIDKTKSSLNQKPQRKKLSAWKRLESISIHLLQNETLAALTTFLFLLGAITIPFYCWIDLFEAF